MNFIKLKMAASNMKLYCLSSSPSSPCYVLKCQGLTIMLDCALDLSPLLNFTPLPLVHRSAGSSLPTYGKSNKENSEVPTDSELYTVFKDCLGHALVDSQHEVRLPETGLVDLSTVDVILLSNPLNMLALPFITEELGFDGLVYATVPSAQLGRHLLEEMADYVHGHLTLFGKEQDDMQNWKKLAADLPEDAIKDGKDCESWRRVMTTESVSCSMAKVRPVAFGERLNLFGLMEAEAVSSGYTLGSCNWLLRANGVKMVYLSASSLLTTHAEPIDRHSLLESDVLILSCLSSAPNANPDTMLSELCGKMGAVLRSGGNVLAPCYPGGIVYDLIECVIGFLDSQGLSHVPVYYVSPVAKSSLAYANIYAEWLCSSKQARTYLPEPPFLHEDFIKNGRLKIFSSVDSSNFSSSFRSPCIVFAGHPSLRFGPVVHLLEAWGGSSKNAMFITEPGFDYLQALGPYQPLAMKAFYFPVDPRLTFLTGNKLLKEVAPKALIIPDVYLNTTADKQELEACVLKPAMPCQTVSRGTIVTLDTPAPVHALTVSSEVATSLNLQNLSSGIHVAGVHGVLQMNNNKFEVVPSATENIAGQSMLWGSPLVDGIVANLQEVHKLPDVRVKTENGKHIIEMCGSSACIVVSESGTTIQCSSGGDEKLRLLLKSVLLSQLPEL